MRPEPEIRQTFHTIDEARMHVNPESVDMYMMVHGFLVGLKYCLGDTDDGIEERVAELRELLIDRTRRN